MKYIVILKFKFREWEDLSEEIFRKQHKNSKKERMKSLTQ